MSTLYEITGQYLELYEMMESADELEMKVIEDTLDGIYPPSSVKRHMRRSGT